MTTVKSLNLSALIEAAKTSKKYRDLDLPEEFLLDLAQEAAQIGKSAIEVKTIFRKNLHNVIAPYLEETDYKQETKSIQITPELLNDLPAYCLSMMDKHASTRERIPYLSEFFKAIQEEIGTPTTVIDLACALDPLCLPWIQLAPHPEFLAYDVNGARILYLQELFRQAFPFAKAIQRDIFVQTPQQFVDCVFFFKEAHRLEKRQPGGTAMLLQKLNADVIVISLPAVDLAKHHSLEQYHSNLIDKSVGANNWSVRKARVGDELLFFIRKGGSI